jgi:hypothetical protein
MFDNRPSGPGSRAVEVVLDTQAMTAVNGWEYAPSTPITSTIFGDVQLLPNLNRLVTFSTQGVIHEVDAQNRVVQTMTWSSGMVLGYVIQRPTLYGPSPK